MNSEPTHFMLMKNGMQINYFFLIFLLCFIFNIFLCYNIGKSSQELHFNVRIIVTDSVDGSSDQNESTSHMSSTFSSPQIPSKPRSLNKYVEIAHNLLQEFSKSYVNHPRTVTQRGVDHPDENNKEEYQVGDTMTHGIKSRVRRDKKRYKVYYGNMHPNRNKLIPVFSPEKVIKQEENLRQTDTAESALGYFLDFIHISDLISEIIRGVINRNLDV